MNIIKLEVYYIEDNKKYISQLIIPEDVLSGELIPLPVNVLMEGVVNLEENVESPEIFGDLIVRKVELSLLSKQRRISLLEDNPDFFQNISLEFEFLKVYFNSEIFRQNEILKKKIKDIYSLEEG